MKWSTKTLEPKSQRMILWEMDAQGKYQEWQREIKKKYSTNLTNLNQILFDMV
jgi:hypothetical protein